MTGALPWRLPGREQWLRLEPHHNPDRPYALVAGTDPGRVHTSLSADELRALRDGIDAILEQQEADQ